MILMSDHYPKYTPSITDLYNYDYLLPAYYNIGTVFRTLQMFNLSLQNLEVNNYFYYTEEETKA